MKNEKIKNFFNKLKANRAVYITALTLLVALAMVIAITVAANRSKKNNNDNVTQTTLELVQHWLQGRFYPNLSHYRFDEHSEFFNFWPVIFGAFDVKSFIR